MNKWMDMWTNETDRWAQEQQDAKEWLKDVVRETEKKASNWDWLRQMGNTDRERYQRRFVYKRTP